jgi:hypothetical protein
MLKDKIKKEHTKPPESTDQTRDPSHDIEISS